MHPLTKYEEYRLRLLVAVLEVFGRVLILSRFVILTVSRELVNNEENGSETWRSAEPKFVKFLSRIFASEDDQRVLSRLAEDDVFWEALASGAMNDGESPLEDVACYVLSSNEFPAEVHQRIVQAFIDSHAGSPAMALYATTRKNLRPRIWEKVVSGAEEVDARGVKVSDDDKRISVALEMASHSSGRHVEKATDLFLTPRYRDAVLRRAIEINKVLESAREFAPLEQREAIDTVQALIRAHIPWKSRDPVRPRLIS